MSKGRDRIVYRSKDGDWVNKRVDAGKASSKHTKQGEAIKTTTKMLSKQGGGELIVKGEKGKIRSKDTIPPGRDPNPPKDKEH